MSYESTRAAIASRIEAQWPSSVAAAYPIVSENQPFKGGVQPSGPWARYSIRPAANITQDISNHSRQIIGLVWLQIFVPENDGVRPAMLMADAMETIFAEQRIIDANGLIRFERAELQPAGVDSGLAQWSCLVRYRDDLAF